MSATPEYLRSRGFAESEQSILESATAGTHGLAKLLASLGATGAEEALSLDPTDKGEGFKDLETWVDGSLDMYKPEFRPILFPIFVHFYLDLIEFGFKDAAISFFRTYSPSLAPSHASTLHHLATLLLPFHVQSDELAQRYRNEKYAVRMSRSGFGLLIGWLTEGTGGEAPGAGHGFAGERGRRGRAAVMRVVNNHVQFDVTTSSSSSVSIHAWEESTGLLSSLTQVNGTSEPSRPMDPQAFNASRGELKLGPFPVDDALRQEAERRLREQQMNGFDPEVSGSSQLDLPFPFGVVPAGIVAPSTNDLLPRPPQFRTVDVQREMDRVRDARKRIKLDPSVLSGDVDIHGFDKQSSTARAKALPSICAYTLHDAADGAPCSTFSMDSTLMAAGFSESYIRLFSLKQEKLRGMRSDFQESTIRDSASLRRVKEKVGTTTRKLIGHSGPVYSVAFDPLGGSAIPPRYLLSSSADSTARLWSMDTMTNVVAYRGHQGPVWDAQWSPMGIYFASGSKDRTARLWSTDRVSALRVYAGHLSDVDCVRFHPNSLYLATGSSDWTCRLWDVQKGSCLRVFVGHQGAVSSLAMSPDGRYLASAGEDLAINLWDLGSGRRIKRMTGHTSSIYSLAFSAESSLLVSGGSDWTVRCWDVKSAGGLPTKTSSGDNLDGFGLDNRRSNGLHESGALPLGVISDTEEENIETTDLLSTFPTKRTPIINVQFTPRNLCLVSGPFLSLDQS
ncbi:TFIID and SAGA subunit [Ramaria rubella]|nr:TFIID and SAGA subunit [Ramaria rubella]